MPHSLPESILSWVEIKAAVPVMLRAGVSTIGMLAWSQGRSLAEVRTCLGSSPMTQVQRRLQEVRDMPHIGHFLL